MDERELKELRGRIDAVDERLVALFGERMALSAQIGGYKRARGLPVRDAAREKALLARIRALAGERGEEAEALYQTILALSRQAQQQTLRCGLIGKPLGHSYSPAIHRRLGAYAYRLIELEAEELGAFLQAGDFDGLNVTIPYKKAVIPFCARLSDTTKRIGSVNTIVRAPDGSLSGYNTDYDGFLRLFRRSGRSAAGKKALVLGSGGASATVQAALRDLGAAEVVVISRTGENNYVNLYERHADASILVNATPVGMAPHNGTCLVELKRFPALEAVFDLIYNPAKTALLLQAERLGLPAYNGLPMLAAQAAASSALFTGEAADEATVDRITEDLERQMKNILLIGMPGSGKTTLGAALARQLGRPFFDSDGELERRAGRDIPTIFREEGEEGFRRREHELLVELTRRSGAVIAVGGGAVTRAENLDLLRQNSRVVWLRRPLSALSTEGRPLSQSRSIEDLWREREALYRAAADRTADNTGTPEEGVQSIMEALNDESAGH
ncbi:MAG: chorismate mutase [Oscillospiraceae bacterium]|nr:chorismate mutase [Oscillospiraceae bacterium]